MHYLIEYTDRHGVERCERKIDYMEAWGRARRASYINPGITVSMMAIAPTGLAFPEMVGQQRFINGHRYGDKQGRMQ